MAWYSSGTVSITNGTNAVIGASTAFIVNARVGDAFLGPDGRWYEITNVPDNITMSISPPYLGTTVSGGSYRIVPIQGYVKASADLLRSVTMDLTNRLEAIDNLDAAELSYLDGVTSNIQTQLDSKFTGNPTYLADRANHTGTQAVSTISGLQTTLDGKQPLNSLLTATTASFTTTLKTKLDGIATAATANASDATLLARSNHTGTQLAATISDFNTAADARVTAGITGKEPSIAAGTTTQYWRGDKSWQELNSSSVGLGNVSNTSDAAKNTAAATLTNKTISGSDNTLVNIAQASVTNLVADLANKQPLTTVLTNTTASFTTALETKLNGVTAGATANSNDATLLARANHTGTQLSTTISDFDSAADARVVTGITGKQDILISGTTIKTVNGASILGSGNLVITGGGGVAGVASVNGDSGPDVFVATVAQGALADTALQSADLPNEPYLKKLRMLALGAM